MARKTITPRAQQALETKKRIIRISKELFAKSGFDSVSVNEISKEAGITVGTFYYYFDSKEELLFEHIPKITSYQKSKAAREVKDAHSYIQLMTFFNYIFQYPFFKQWDLMWCILTSERAIQKIDQSRIPMIDSIIKRGQERGEFTTDYSSLYIAKILFNANRGIFIHSVLSKDESNYVSSEQDVISRIAYSYLTEKGRQNIPIPKHG